MILDGNTDWSPDDDDHVIGGANGSADGRGDGPSTADVVDPGATVGIGPLPSPSVGAEPSGPSSAPGTETAPAPISASGSNASSGSVDGIDAGSAPTSTFGPLLEPAPTDRPPMVTGPFLGDEDSSSPYSWVATGPLPAGDTGLDPLPTGPIPVTLPAETAAAAAPTAKVFLQAGVVLLAAALVGLVVFGVLRSAAGDRSGSDEADLDRSNGTSLDPGPGDPGGNGDLVGSKRGTAGLGQQRDDDGTASSDGDGSDTGTPTPTRGTEAEDDRPSGQGDPTGSGTADPAGPTTVVARSGPPTTVTGRSGSPTTVAVDRLPSSITPGVNSTNTSARPTATAVTSTRPTTPTTQRTTTTRSSTTRPGSTTTIAQTTTTNASTTTTSLPSSLIAAPAGGSVSTWETTLTLRANAVPGADEYCWTLSGTGGATTRCRSATSYGHAGGSSEPGPGPVSIRAEARAADGRVIMSQQLSITLLARDVIDEPSAATTHELGDRLRLEANRIPGATWYCWTLSQGATSSGQLCGANRNRNLGANSSVLDGFEAGSVTVRLVAERSGVVVGRQSVRVEFVDP